MKRLFLMRHAEAETHNRSDLHRKLTRYGEQQALNVGCALQMLHRPDLIIVSPSDRTQQTALILAEEAGCKQVEIRAMPLLYQATEETLRSIIITADPHVEKLMVVAHNPGVSNLIENMNIRESTNQAMLGGFIFPTAGLVSLTVRVDNWAEFFEHPAEVDFIILK